MNKPRVILLLMSSLLFWQLQAQNLDQIGKKGGIKFSGGLSAGQDVYFSNGIDERYNPYNYMLSANASASLYGWSIPFTAVYSNRELSYGQPFNIVGLSPKYKSLTVHGGYRSMSFSQYTLSGRSFYGGGVEWKPTKQKFDVGAMAGRLLRAVDYDTVRPNVAPVMERWGYAFRFGYSLNNTKFKYIWFYAKDVKESVDFSPEVEMPDAQENFVHNLTVDQKVNDVVSVFGELAVSAWTKDLTDSLSEESEFYKKVFFIPSYTSTFYYKALKTGIKFNLPAFNWGVNYEMIDPEFHSLGAYNIAGDFQNITANAGTSFFEKKLNVNANAGIQKDDLKNQKMTNTRRFVGSLALAFTPNKRLNLNANYSGFNALMQVKPYEESFVQNTVYDQLDTMNMIQLTNTFSTNGSYVLKESDAASQRLNISGNYQVASSEQGSQRFGNSLASGVAGYSVQIKSLGMSVSVNSNTNVTFFDDGNTYYLGLSSNVGMPLLQKKLKASLSANASQNIEKGEVVATLFALNNNYSITLWKKHNLSMGMRYSGRVKHQESEKSAYNQAFHEFMANMKYSWRL